MLGDRYIDIDIVINIDIVISINVSYRYRYIPNSYLTVAPLERGMCFSSPSTQMPSV